MDNIFSMLIVNESCIVLVSYSESKIIEFDPNNKHVKIVKLKSDGPVQVSTMERNDQVLYLVTCHGNKHKVKVYDKMWNLLFTFGGWGYEDGHLWNPWGTACTTDGILVADQSNHRISQFSFEGKFLKHILTRDDGIGYPTGLTFVNPYLWVTSHSPPSVQCFKLYN